MSVLLHKPYGPRIEWGQRSKKTKKLSTWFMDDPLQRIHLDSVYVGVYKTFCGPLIR